MIKAIKSTFIESENYEQLNIWENAYLIYEKDRIIDIFPTLPSRYKGIEILEHPGFVIPGFKDLHLHGVQYANMGLGYDKELLPWLKSYTFPEEEKFENLDYAQQVFSDLIQDLIRYGTTSVAMFSSLHKDSSILLMKMLEQAGISGYVGKVNMDRNGVEGLEEETEESYRQTIAFLEEAQQFQRIQPIITPRFIPSCSKKLLQYLGELVKERNLAVQSHLNENHREIAWVRELVPEARNYLDAYLQHDLLPEGKTIMAHCIYNEEWELEILKKRNIFAAHCPTSNLNLQSGVMEAKEFLERGIKMGLGSDIAGGEHLSMLSVMKSAIQASNARYSLLNGKSKLLNYRNAFYLATKGGGEFFGQSGDFSPGSAMDVLLIQDDAFNHIKNYQPEERLQRLIYLGDDRNIVGVIAGGRRIKT